jgi:hypothetical protein
MDISGMTPSRDRGLAEMNADQEKAIGTPEKKRSRLGWFLLGAGSMAALQFLAGYLS